MLGFLRELVQLWRRQKRNWQLVVTHQVVHRFLIQLTEQYTTIFIRMLGASPVQLGWARSAAGISGTLISLPLGIVQDRYSLRKIYLTGISLWLLVPLFYGVAPSWEFVIPGVFLAGLAQRLGSCAVICDVSLKNRDRATARSLCEGVGAFPTLLAPLLGAGLVTMLGGITLDGIRPLFWLQFVARALLFTYMLTQLTEVVREHSLRPGKVRLLGDFRTLFREGRGVVQCLLFLSLSFIGKTLILTFMYPIAYEVKGAGAFAIGGITVAITLAEALFAAVFGRMADRIGRKKTYYILAPFILAGTFLFAWAPSPPYLFLAGFFLGFRVIAEVLLSALPVELVPARYIGRWRGLIGLCTGLVGIPAPILGGYLWEWVGPEYIFVAVGLIDVLVVLPLIRSLPETADLADDVDSV